ncbi:MAG: hypothetical protein KA175_01335 [Flavobacteriales bacterium]|nr:hypothetical protein [Flavobacteriales bacterium]MBP6696228.1 hypothetical protein [Flavobacteriales bacterium]
MKLSLITSAICAGRVMVFVSSIVLANSGKAQLSVQSLQVEGTFLSPSSLFAVGVLNSGVATNVHLEGSVRTRAGVLVLSWRSASFVLAGGISNVRSAQIALEVFRFEATEPGRYADLKRRLPGGDYIACMTVRSAGEGSDELCEELFVDHMLVLDHVHPLDRDTVDDRRPPLLWTYAGEVLPTVSNYFRLSLFPQPEDRNAAQSVAAEKPLFTVTQDLQRTVPFPMGVPDLEPGKWYAWQVDYVENGRVVERAEPWSFHVREHIEPEPNKYVRLDDDQAGRIYEVVDGKIYFRYDEPYSSSVLDCSILTAAREVIEPEVSGDATEDTPAQDVRSVGVNLYELDLQPYGLGKGYYELIVKNEKGRADRLKFHVSR